MESILLYALLGCGVGAAYALTGVGIVLIHKGSGVVNFAQGAVAMAAAFTCNELVMRGMSVYAAAAVTIAGAGLAGVVMYGAVMRPLRNASSLSQVIATIGLLLLILGVADKLWSKVAISGILAPQLVPTDPVQMLGSVVGQDRFWLLGIVAALCLILTWVYRYTNFGLATRAAAESERGASLLGISPDRVAAGNWALGFAVAALAGILIAPIAALNVTALAFIVLPALAAALIGRFTSFGWTVLAGILIGVAQSLITAHWSLQGLPVAFPLLVVIAAIVITGRRIPVRGTLEIKRPPLSADGRIRPFWLVAIPAVVVATLLVANLQLQNAVVASMIAVMVSLSVVVVTGFVGQVNLAPLSFAACGAFGVSILGHGLGWPFPLPLLAAAVVAVPVGVLIGLPALRVRGVNLAVVTLGVGIAMDAAIFQNYDISGGARGRPVPSPEIFGFSLDSSAHPARFGVLTLVVLLLLTWMVCNVRGSSVGRKMLAVRRNERAAAAAGINIASVKLYAFGLSAFIAAISGGLLAYQAGATTGDGFSTALSLVAVAVAFIGGIASVSGAFAAGFAASGGVVYVLLNQISGISSYWAAITGALLILTVVTQPDGMAITNMTVKSAVLDRLRQPSRARRAEPGGVRGSA